MKVDWNGMDWNGMERNSLHVITYSPHLSTQEFNLTIVGPAQSTLGKISYLPLARTLVEYDNVLRYVWASAVCGMVCGVGRNM